MSEAAGQADFRAVRHTGENLEVDAGCTTVLITIFDSSHRY